MAAFGLVILGLAFLVSILFNLLQLKWRNEERAARAEDNAEQKRKGDGREAEQRLKEQAAPLFFNFDGAPGPILVTGSQHSSQGPFVYLWGLVTVVNRTQLPMKITPLRLIMAGEEWPVQSISFHLKSNTTERSDSISLRGNDKEDYELHFRFQDDKCATGSGDVWFASDNRAEQFPVPVRFP
ncbi:MAG: hypothetical protein WB660_05280 [Candidatus Sulfotelmatobacter sp.]